MSFLRSLFGLVSRILILVACLAALLTTDEIQQCLAGETPNIQQLSERLENHDVRESRTVVIGALIGLGVGGLMFVTGALGRLGAILLLIVFASATCRFFPFWQHDKNTVLFANQLQTFLINAGICGGLLLFAINKFAWNRRSDIDDEYELF